MPQQGEAIHEGSQFRKILAHAPWYLGSSLLSKALGFFLLPVYTRYLSPSDYGILATLQSFGMLASIALSLYMDTAFIRFYYKARTVSESAVRRLYSTYFWFIICWGSVSSLILILLAPMLMEELLGISLLPLVLVITTQLLSQLTAMVLGMWRAELQAKKVAVITLGNTAIVATITLLLLIHYEFGWMSQIYAALFGIGLQSLLLIFIAIKSGWISFEFDKDILYQGLIFAIPLIPNIAAGWIAGYSDRLILSYYGKLDEVGLYSIAYQFAYILYIFNDSVTQVQGPISMSGLTSDRERARKQIVEFVSVYTWIMAVLYLGMALFSREVIEWFLDPRYVESYKVIAILASLYAISGLYRVFSTVISFHKKTWIISTAAIFQALVNIVLNFIFIPMFGMYAAAFSSLFSLFAYLGWIVYRSQKLEPVKLPWRAVSTTAAGVVIVLAVWYWLDHANWTPMMLVYKFSLLVGFVII
ncbi:MAG TPA: flippase, partial [Gammaproteobacteria bacterium]|nr:flippase [Gammaproteobacteria bacterium]